MGQPKVRSDKLRKLIMTAVRQGWRSDLCGNHPSIVCPVCGHREIYTTSGRMHTHEIKKKIARLRRHGLIFDGRGGIHE